MLKKLRFPIRFKILVTLLVVITTVVSVITFIMANLFHEDKKAYIHDLTSTASLNAAAKTETLLIGYQERLKVFTRLILDRSIPSRAKAKLLQKTFVDFDDFVSITLYQDNREPVTVFDARMLETKGLSRTALDRYREEHPLPLEMIAGGAVFIENATWDEKLPIMTLAVANPDQDDRDETVAVATILLERLTRLSQQSQVFNTFIMTADGTLLAHPESERVAVRDTLTLPFEIDEVLGRGELVEVREYRLGNTDYIGGFAPIRIGNMIAIAQVPKSAAYLTARELVSNMLALSLLLLVFSALLSLLW